VLIQHDAEDLRGNHAGGKPTHIGKTGGCCHDIAVQGFSNLVETIVRGWRGQRHQNHHRDDNGEPAWAWRGKEPQPCQKVQQRKHKRGDIAVTA